MAFDWRIRVQPPLVVRNALPVAAQYIVWERATGVAPKGLTPGGGSGALRACGWGRIDAWGTAQVYTADMRQQVRLINCCGVCVLGGPHRYVGHCAGVHCGHTAAGAGTAVDRLLWSLRFSRAASTRGALCRCTLRTCGRCRRCNRSMAMESAFW